MAKTYKSDRLLLSMLSQAMGSTAAAVRLLTRAIDEPDDDCPCTVRIMQLTMAEVGVRDRAIRCIVPLSPGVVWNTHSLIFEQAELPDTALQAHVGRPLRDMVAHHAITPDIIIEGWDIDDGQTTIDTHDSFIDLTRIRTGPLDIVRSMKDLLIHPVVVLVDYMRDYLRMVHHVRKCGNPGKASGFPFGLMGGLMLLIACVLMASIPDERGAALLVIVPMMVACLCIFVLLTIAAVDTHYGYPSTTVSRMPERDDPKSSILGMVRAHRKAQSALGETRK